MEERVFVDYVKEVFYGVISNRMTFDTIEQAEQWIADFMAREEAIEATIHISRRFKKPLDIDTRL